MISQDNSASPAQGISQTAQAPLERDLESLSVWMDGELPPLESEALMQHIKKDVALKDEWELYHLIGDVLKSDDMAHQAPGFCAAVKARLDAEPHVFAPSVVRASQDARGAGSVNRGGWFKPAAVAAALGATAVVGWNALTGSSGRDEVAAKAAPTPALVTQQASTSSSPTAAVVGGTSSLAAVPVAPAAATGSREVRDDFLAAHRQYSSGLAVQGSVRAVSAVVAYEPAR